MSVIAPSSHSPPDAAIASCVAFEINWVHKYVSKQYLDNTMDENRTLDAFYVSHLRMHFDATYKSIKSIRIGLQINNLFNAMYEPNGYTFSYKAGGSVITENYYYPQAGRNILYGVTFSF